MKNNTKTKSGPAPVILCIIAIIFLAYGVYMVADSIAYVKSYTGNAVATKNAFQYIITSSVVYFGFAGVFFLGAYIVGLIKKTSSIAAPIYYDNFNEEEALEQEEIQEIPETENLSQPEVHEESEEREEHNVDSISSSMIKDIFEKK